MTHDAQELWIDGKYMKGMSFWDPSGDRPNVDLFVEYPLDFDALLSSATEAALQRTHCRIASTAHLITNALNDSSTRLDIPVHGKPAFRTM